MVLPACQAGLKWNFWVYNELIMACAVFFNNMLFVDLFERTSDEILHGCDRRVRGCG